VNPKDLQTAIATPIDQDWVARARAITPLLYAAGPQIDADKGLSRDLLDALFDARMFRMLLPRAQGGAELDLPTFFEVVQAIAEGDASAAWSVAQSNACAMSAAYMTPQAAAELFADPRAVLAWGFPTGPCRMQPVDGGWRVTGVWGFGSGSRHATWLGAHCQVLDAEGNVVKKADGSPQERTALIPRGAVTIVDAKWDVLGLRGTGSDTYAVTDMFVPAEHSVVPRAVGRDQQQPADAVPEPETERRETGVLYRFSPTVAYQAGFAAVAIGIARTILNDFIKLANQKTPSSGNVMLRDNAVIQHRVAVSEARIASMRAWLRQSLTESWDECERSGQHAFEHRVTMRLASTYAIREVAKVVEDAYADAGATAIFASHPFERRLRDMHAVTQQIQSHPIHLQTAGQHYLGMKASTRFI
jgi:alkylation response protein AidB-like acyl-CoA dehydrogenase